MLKIMMQQTHSYFDSTPSQYHLRNVGKSGHDVINYITVKSREFKTAWTDGDGIRRLGVRGFYSV